MWENILDEVGRYVWYVVGREGLVVDVDEDLLGECFLRVWNAVRNYDEGKAKMSTYAYYVVRSAVVDELLKRKNKVQFVEIEKVKDSLGGGRSFYAEYERVLDRWKNLIGDDLLRILRCDLSKEEYSNLLRSARLSQVKGVQFLEKYLWRRLTEAERKCLCEIESLLW